LADSGKNTKRQTQTTPKGASQLSTTTVKTKAKRPSKGMRKHIRLVKQEARKNSIPGAEVKKGKRPS
jgi:hypothetical protein